MGFRGGSDEVRWDMKMSERAKDVSEGVLVCGRRFRRGELQRDGWIGEGKGSE